MSSHFRIARIAWIGMMLIVFGHSLQAQDTSFVVFSNAGDVALTCSCRPLKQQEGRTRTTCSLYSKSEEVTLPQKALEQIRRTKDSNLSPLELFDLVPKKARKKLDITTFGKPIDIDTTRFSIQVNQTGTKDTTVNEKPYSVHFLEYKMLLDGAAFHQKTFTWIGKLPAKDEYFKPEIKSIYLHSYRKKFLVHYRESSLVLSRNAGAVHLTRDYKVLAP